MYFVHSGVCDAQPKMRVKLKQMGYYWPTMLYGLCETLQHFSNIWRLYAKPLASYRSILAYLSIMR